MPATTQLAMTRLNVTDARCEALFASTLQPSDAPTAGMVAEAISRTVQQLGTGGCLRQMAQEFGEHPDLAAERMRWARRLAALPPPDRRRHHRPPAAGPGDRHTCQPQPELKGKGHDW